MRSETFQTPGPVALKLRLPAGEIELDTHDAPETSVELEARRGDEDDVTIELRERGEGHEVVVEVASGLLRGRGEYRVAIRAPHGADVDADLASADLDARGRLGAVEVRTASGDLKAQEVEGDLRVNTASGDVLVKRVGREAAVNTASGDVLISRVEAEATVRSASGDVAIREADSGLRVQTASGDQLIGSVAEGEVALQSASGDIEVAIRPGSKVWIDVRSMSGETTSELELDDSPPEGEGPLVELRATSMSGDIRVRRRA